MHKVILQVTDLKQYCCCPRIIFYRYHLPHIRPVTYLMEEGIRQHEREEEREIRRSLKPYQIKEGERFFHTTLQSQPLGISGKIDLVIAVPDKEASGAEAYVVEYKFSEQKAGAHFKLQLAAYALLVETAWGIPVKQGFIYSIPLRRAEPCPLTTRLRKQVEQTVAAIHKIIEQEHMPEATAQRARCLSCEFRRFCNDVV